MHPQKRYRERLLRSLDSTNCRTVLEVGCGGGGFLRSVTTRGLALQGIDPDVEAVHALQTEGFAAQVGVAEALPFQDASFDLVVFCYTAHHIVDWSAALSQGLRVCHLGVAVLDPWYDDSLASQRTARAFDRWSKRIDRENGIVHNDCMDATALMSGAVSAAPHVTIDYQYMLSLLDLGVAGLESAGLGKLKETRDGEPWRRELSSLINQARETGFSDDGAVLMTLMKRR